MKDYNHKAGNLGDATGLDLEKLSTKTSEQVVQWMGKEDETNTSFLTKRLEDSLSTRELAVLATQHVLGSIERAQSSPEMMEKAKEEALAKVQSEGNKD